jgi:archaellin
MSLWRGTGITTMIILISFLLIGITVASVMTDETTDTSTEYDLEQMTDEVIDEITSYIQIKDQKGKFSEINGEKRIEKIAILISPLVSQNIDLSQLSIQLDNGDIIRILDYQGDAENLNSQSIFEHDIWNLINGSNFGFITINDLDKSIVDFDLINENSDNAYLIFKLPLDMTMEKYDKMLVTMFPSTGIITSTFLKAPMPMTSIVTFE